MPDIVVLFIAMISFFYGASTYLYSDRKARKAYKRGVKEGKLVRSKHSL